MTNTIGRVNFTAVLDGKNMDRDARTAGEKAGAAGAAGYDKTWSKGFQDSLTKAGKQSYEAWKKHGDESGRLYSTAMSERINKQLREANKNFEGLRLDAGFLDEWNKGFDDAGLAAGELQKQIKLLEDAGEGNASAFRAARRQIDEWAEAQRQAAFEANKAADEHEAAIEGLTADLRQQSNEYAINARAAEDAARAEAQLIENQRQHTEARDNLIRVIRDHNTTIAETNREYETNIRLSDAIIDKAHQLAEAHREHSFAWKDLSHNTRQWTLIIGAVLAGMEDLAVLGSAAGAGIIALGAAATSGIIGVGGLAAVFVTLNKDLESLPENLRPVAEEFDRFKSVFGELRETIAEGAFRQMGGVFDGLGTTLRSLNPELEKLGVTVGKLFSEFETNVQPGSEAFEQIRKSVELASPNFASLSQSAGTFGEGLLRAFNRSQPLVQDLLNYVDRLATQFEAFSRSNGFTDWIERSRATWESFGGLLDAVGRSLNDLVTPESARRTQAFLDTLADFVPNLTKFLDILGRLDIFGIIAVGLDSFGRAMEPLAESTAELATSLNALIVDVLQDLAPVLSDIASILAPVVAGIAGLVSALPDAGASQGLILLAGAFVTFKAAASISGGLAAIAGLRANLTGLGPIGARAADGIGKATSAIGKMAGYGTGIAIGVGVLANALTNLADAGAKAAPGVERVMQALKTGDINGAFQNASQSVDSFSESLKLLTGDDLDSQIERFGQGLGESLGITGSLREARDGVAALDAALAQMVGSGQGEQAAELFARIRAEAKEQGVSLEELTQLFPAYDDASLAAAESSRQVAEAMLAVSETAGLSAEEIAELSARITEFQSTTFNARGSAREYEAAIDDLTESIQKNGATLDIGTEQGRANQAAVDDLAQSVLDLTAKTIEQTGSTEQATGVMEKGRAKLIEMLGAFGITGQAAEDYADQLGLIPENVDTTLRLDTKGAYGAIQGFFNTWDGKRMTVYVDGSFSAGPGQPRATAAGGTFYGPDVRLIGEAGPEAVVPLNRPLSQVDESVRWLSAIAQGLAPQPMGAGGIAGGGTNITFAEGSVVAYEVHDAGAVANEFVRQIFERVNG